MAGLHTCDLTLTAASHADGQDHEENGVRAFCGVIAQGQKTSYFSNCAGIHHMRPCAARGVAGAGRTGRSGARVAAGGADTGCMAAGHSELAAGPHAWAGTAQAPGRIAAHGEEAGAALDMACAAVLVVVGRSEKGRGGRAVPRPVDAALQSHRT